jgi:hypothetical protein
VTKRRNLDREKLELYFIYLLLAYRPLLRISGLLLLLYSIGALPINPKSGCIALAVAIVLVLPSYSYQVTLYLAKIGAWVGTIGKKNG